MEKQLAKKRIEKLREEIEKYRYAYHVLDKSLISDAALDSLKNELQKLENDYPEFITPDSPTQRVAGKPLDQFKKTKHAAPMMSLFDAFSPEDMMDWEERLEKILDFTPDPLFNLPLGKGENGRPPPYEGGVRGGSVLKRMTDIFNHKHQKKIRRILRKQEIGAEKLLWSKLRNSQQGYKFRRQFGIGNYIADFYCSKLRLVIEIDGNTHSNKKEIDNDKNREKFFNNLGIIVKRYTNHEVYKHKEAVLVDINNTCLTLKNKLKKFDAHITRPHPASPSQGEG